MNKNDISNLISELRAVYKLGPKVLNVNIYNHNRKLRNKPSSRINVPYTNTKDQIITITTVVNSYTIRAKFFKPLKVQLNMVMTCASTLYK